MSREMLTKYQEYGLNTIGYIQIRCNDILRLVTGYKDSIAQYIKIQNKQNIPNRRN